MLAGAAAVSVWATGAMAQVNVAINRPVSLTAGTVNGVALATVTDGVFLPSGQQWQTGTVWWTGLTPTLDIDLGGVFEIDSAIVQVDDNDTYLLQYRDTLTGLYSTIWNIPQSSGGGMRTRPNVADDGERFVFPSGPISTDSVRILAASGDNLYSVSEVQVFSIPSPSAAAFLGLGGLMAARRRR
jgi:hypothetical protein